MPNYYEQLKLQPSATDTEIETAIEEQYTQWRRLVTHHDTSVVNQANQSLQILETIRTVLTDPGKRSIYDAGVGVSGPIGGLADPEALLRITVPSAQSTPTPIPPPTSAVPAPRTDVWACGKCQKPNPLGTRFCNQCGAEVGKECPKCGKITEATGRFCAHCGANMAMLLEEKRYFNQSVDDDLARARTWNVELEKTRGSVYYLPALDTRVVSGSFADVFDCCTRAVSQFRYRQIKGLGMAPSTKVKTIDPQTGHIECTLGGSGAYLMNRWTLHIYVQPGGDQRHGIGIVSTYFIPNPVAGNAAVVEQMWDALVQMGLRFSY